MEKRVRTDTCFRAELSAENVAAISAGRKYTSENPMKKSSGHATDMWKIKNSAI